MSTKPRKLASIEKGLTEIVKVLNESEIKSAIKKGSSYVRKCSDPNPDETGIKRHIKHWESIELDKVCLKKGISPPLLSSHQFIIDEKINENQNDEKDDVSKMLVKFSILEGDLKSLYLMLRIPREMMEKNFRKEKKYLNH